MFCSNFTLENLFSNFEQLFWNAASTPVTGNDDKRITLFDYLIETYACGTSKDIVYKKENNKCKKIIKQYKND